LTADFELVEKIYSGGLAKRADSEGVDALSNVERNVLLAWWAKGEIDNGGFALLYSGQIDINKVIDAFNEIGLPALARACSDSKKVFRDHHPPLGQDERSAEVDRLTGLDGLADPWAEQNRIVWESETSFDEAVARYVSRYKEFFDRYL